MEIDYFQKWVNMLFGLFHGGVHVNDGLERWKSRTEKGM